MAFVNLQVSLDELPAAAELEMEPMAESYEQEVRLQQWIIWLPLVVLSFVPLLIAQKLFLLIVPLFLALLALVVSRLVLKKARIKGIALRKHDMAFRSGLYWRKIVMLAFDRVQHVEVSSGPLQRKYGLASLKFFTAGGSGVDLKVDGLTRERAEQIRAYIIGKSGRADFE
jgi:uncharacterized protein